jgi:hypothetical protein
VRLAHGSLLPIDTLKAPSDLRTGGDRYGSPDA